MERKEYNGWTNYETWVVSLWIDNDQVNQKIAHEIMKRKYEHNCEYWDAMKEMVEILLDRETNEIMGLAKDLISGAMSEVNWKEICDAYHDE